MFIYGFCQRLGTELIEIRLILLATTQKLPPPLILAEIGRIGIRVFPVWSPAHMSSTDTAALR